MTRLAACFILLLIPAFAHAAQDRAALPAGSRTPLLKKVDSSIERGVKYLLARQNGDGSFGENDTPPVRKVGETALVTLALISCGESHQSPQMAKAIDYLRKTKPNGREMTYSIALRACVFASIPEPVRGNTLKMDLAWLLGAPIKSGPNAGMYTYGTINWGGDFSNSQYGVLGVWYAAGTGLEVPSAYWKKVENVWRKYQHDDGGWGYRQGWRSSYSSMTAAGAATLYITNDYLHANESQDLLAPAINKPLERSVEWLGKHFAVDRNVGMDNLDWGPAGNDDENNNQDAAGAMGGGAKNPDPGPFIFYMLFGYERVGEASGLTRFGSHRWFDEGAQFLIDIQKYDGSWDGHEPLEVGTRCNTAYALLFLSRGRSPVAIQKLQLGNRWNNRPRDAANFIHFMRHAAERHMNWQIVDADAPIADLREAPILYLSGDRPITLSEQQRRNLLTYVNEGGLLLFVNEGKSSDFEKSVTSLCKDIWPSYSFRDLPADHPVKQNNFPMNGWADPIRGLSNGVRELAILFPSGDASWKWQAGAGATQVNLSPYAPLANLLLYLTDKSTPRYKGETTWIDRDTSAGDAKELRLVARLKYTGNWDPEPLAWARLGNMLHNTQDAELHAVPVEIVEGTLKPGYNLAHLTATDTFDLKPAERDTLKSYLEKGGLLFFDAAGGSSEATLAFEAMMAALYPTTKSEPLPVDHPIYTGRFEGGAPRLAIDAFNYRRGAPGKLPATKLPRLRGYTVNGKLIAIESPEDLTAAMVGYPTAGITGYTPATAMQLLRNIVLWSGTR